MRSTSTPPTRGGSSPKRGQQRPQARDGRGKTGARTQASARPVGGSDHTDKATFRRRRLVVLTVLVLLVVGLVFGVRALVGLVGADEETLPRESGTAPEVVSEDGEPTGPPSDQELANPVDCRPAAIGLTIAPAATTLAEGATTAMPITVANAGQVPCLVDVGDRIQVQIYSGDDLVWTSAHCPLASDAKRLLLDVGDEDVTDFRWTGTRSASGCPDEASVAKAGTYRVVVTLFDSADEPAQVATVEESFTVK